MGSIVRARIKGMRRRIGRAAHRILSRVRRAAQTADFWVQDHVVVVIITMFVLLIAAAAALLWTDWDEVVGLAKEVAPVGTIISIIGGALFKVIRWFQKRRAARLMRETDANRDVPHGDETEGYLPLGAPGTAGEQPEQEDTDDRE